MANENLAVEGREDVDGSPINGFDAQIAAICSVHQATLATRNTKDFRDTGIDPVLRSAGPVCEGGVSESPRVWVVRVCQGGVG